MSKSKGNQLVKALEDAGLTVTEIARRGGWHRTLVHKWRVGAAKPRTINLDKLRAMLETERAAVSAVSVVDAREAVNYLRSRQGWSYDKIAAELSVPREHVAHPGKAAPSTRAALVDLASRVRREADELVAEYRAKIEVVVAACGGPEEAATEIGTSHQNLNHWRDRGVVPSERNRALIDAAHARRCGGAGNDPAPSRQPNGTRVLDAGVFEYLANGIERGALTTDQVLVFVTGCTGAELLNRIGPQLLRAAADHVRGQS